MMLTERDLEILAFEKLWWKHPGAKEAEIWSRWRMSPARYFQVLRALIWTPEAELVDAQLVYRLRRMGYQSNF